VISQKQHAHSILTCGPRGDLTPATCNVFNITAITKPNQPIRILGQTKSYKDLSVTSLNFNEPNEVALVPTNAFANFPNVEHVEFDNVRMTSVVKDAFAGCDKLTTIVVTNNNISHLSDGFARKCSGVRNVTMTNNGLRTIDENALEGLSKLMVLDLSNNSISCIPPKLFSFTPEIVGILLRSNKIQTIDRETFKNLNGLIKVDLMSNAIAFIPAMNFDGTAVNGGFDFDLSDNPIYAIQSDFLEEFFATREVDENPGSSVTLLMVSEGESCIGSTTTVVQSVNLEVVNLTLGNCYANWTDELSQKKVTCGELENDIILESNEPNQHDQVSENNDEVLEQENSEEPMPETPAPTPSKKVKSPPTVKKIKSTPGVCKTDKICRYYVDYKDRYTCVIDGVDSIVTSLGGTHVDQFTDDDVTRVYFTNSALRNIPMVIFSKFKHLSFLSVASCSLGIITKGTFRSCNELSYLDVSNNEIIHVSKGALDICQKLQTIDMSGNPIDTLDQNYKTFIMNKNSPPEAS
jgi:Leucine-rich repeat (LRR) protein